MKELPLISVVTPSYNQGKFLEETIISVLNQDYPRLEYIIVDGGSTDSSLDIIHKYESRLAYWISERDAGQSDAINKGWRRAQGDILAYLNSDDTYEPEALRLAADVMSSHPDVGLIYGACYQMDESGRKVGLFPAQPFSIGRLLLTNFLMQPAVFLKKSVHDTVGMLDTRLHYAMDYDLWLRIALHFPVMPYPLPLANFRGHPGSKSFANPQAFLDDVLFILDRTFVDPSFPAELVTLQDSSREHAALMVCLLCFALNQEKTGEAIWRDLTSRQPKLQDAPDFLIEMIANTMVHNVSTAWLQNQDTDSERWLRNLVDDLFASTNPPSRIEKQILARVQTIHAFDAYRDQRWPEIREFIWRAIRLDHSCLFNPGLRSILLESFLGTGLMETWRRNHRRQARPFSV